MIKKCSKCGSLFLKENNCAKFCPKCGQELMDVDIDKSKIKRIGTIIIIIIFIISIGKMLVGFIGDTFEIKEIESYCDAGEFETAFDILNMSSIPDEKEEIYNELIVEGMNNNRKELRESSSSCIAVIDNIEYHVTKYEIYAKENGEKILLYETPDSGEVLGFYDYYYLSNKRCMYANGFLIFVECEQSTNYKEYKTYYTYRAKSIDLKTKEVKELGRGDRFSDMIKFKNGHIFIGFDILNPTDGVSYNPYTQEIYEGEDVIPEWLLDDYVYKN